MTARTRIPGKRQLGVAARVLVNFRGERLITLRRSAFRLLRLVTPAVAVDRDGIRIFVSTADETGSWLFAFDKLLDEPHLASAVALASRFYPRPSSERGIFLDVGANIGTTCIPAVLRHGFSEAIAVEPAPSNVVFLRQNVVANGVADRVRVVHAAATDEEGEVEMELSAQNWSDHRVRIGRGEPGLFGEDGRATTTVPASTIDAILAAESVKPEQLGMVWMDIQGFEAHALAGASSVLDADVPVVIEYWPYGLQRLGALERLWDLAAGHYQGFVDVRQAGGADAPRSIDQLPRLEVAGADGFTDLLLVK